MELNYCFNQNGNLLIDPYHINKNDKWEKEIYDTIFDVDGNVKAEVLHPLALPHLIIKNNWSFRSDAVRIIYAYEIPDFTHNNYTSVFAWR